MTGPDQQTVGVYERRAREWREQRRPQHTTQIEAFGSELRSRDPDAVAADLGCGPGWHCALLGEPVVALDASSEMLALVGTEAAGALRVRGDLGALPFRSGALGGALASKSYVHVPRTELPRALGELHRAMPVGAPVLVQLFGGDAELAELDGDDFAGRRFALWDEHHLLDVLVGAGFTIESSQVTSPVGTATSPGDAPDPRPPLLTIRASRARTLADTVGRDMRVLLCGLNPSLYAADAGIPFARPGNRFWPAALAAGLVSVDRDPHHALVHHSVGMTDLVKRATGRADELTRGDFEEGLARVERLVTWLGPAVVCFVGLAGWRAAVDRRATAGLQPARLGDAQVYVMPSTSGLNAHSTPASLTAHLREVDTLTS